MIKKYWTTEDAMEISIEGDLPETEQEFQVIKLSELNELLDGFEDIFEIYKMDNKIWYCIQNTDWKKLRDELK